MIVDAPSSSKRSAGSPRPASRRRESGWYATPGGYRTSLGSYWPGAVHTARDQDLRGVHPCPGQGNPTLVQYGRRLGMIALCAT